MLVLARKLHESIIIGDITITVVTLSTGKVSLGIKAPPEKKILRAELQQKEALEPCKA